MSILAFKSESKAELSDLQKEYRSFFSGLLKEYGVESPIELSEEDKSKFFSEVTPRWEEMKERNGWTTKAEQNG